MSKEGIKGLGKRLRKMWEEKKQREKLLFKIKEELYKRDMKKLEHILHQLQTANREDYQLTLQRT